MPTTCHATCTSQTIQKQTMPTTTQVISAILIGAPLALAGITEQQYADEFGTWCIEQNTDCNSVSKFNNFKVSYDRVQAVNNDDTLTYTLELNKFAGMSNDEWKKQYLGMRPSAVGPRDLAQYVSTPNTVSAPAA